MQMVIGPNLVFWTHSFNPIRHLIERTQPGDLRIETLDHLFSLQVQDLFKGAKVMMISKMRRCLNLQIPNPEEYMSEHLPDQQGGLYQALD
jgi:hypothetical protein